MKQTFLIALMAMSINAFSQTCAAKDFQFGSPAPCSVEANTTAHEAWMVQVAVMERPINAHSGIVCQPFYDENKGTYVFVYFIDKLFTEGEAREYATTIRKTVFFCDAFATPSWSKSIIFKN